MLCAVVFGVFFFFFFLKKWFTPECFVYLGRLMLLLFILLSPFKALCKGRMQQHSDSVSALDLNSQEQEQCVDCQTISCEVETDTRC